MTKLTMFHTEETAIHSEDVNHLLEDAARVFVEEGNIANSFVKQSSQPKKRHAPSVSGLVSQMESDEKVRSWLRDLENDRRGVA
jgi:hypothetical protein